MPKLFVSHSHEDSTFVEEFLLVALQVESIPYWYSGHEILTAEKFQRNIISALEDCDWFCVVISQKALSSEWVQAEVSWAFEHRRGRIIPIMLEKCDAYQLHLMLPQLQHLDLLKHEENMFDTLKTYFANWKSGLSPETVTGYWVYMSERIRADLLRAGTGLSLHLGFKFPSESDSRRFDGYLRCLQRLGVEHADIAELQRLFIVAANSEKNMGRSDYSDMESRDYYVSADEFRGWLVSTATKLKGCLNESDLAWYEAGALLASCADEASSMVSDAEYFYFGRLPFVRWAYRLANGIRRLRKHQPPASLDRLTSVLDHLDYSGMDPEIERLIRKHAQSLQSGRGRDYQRAIESTRSLIEKIHSMAG